jgi:hypothetical protein
MNIINKINAYQVCDVLSYIPVVSTITTLFHAVMIQVKRPGIDEETRRANDSKIPPRTLYIDYLEDLQSPPNKGAESDEEPSVSTYNMNWKQVLIEACPFGKLIQKIFSDCFQSSTSMASSEELPGAAAPVNLLAGGALSAAASYVTPAKGSLDGWLIDDRELDYSTRTDLSYAIYPDSSFFAPPWSRSQKIYEAKRVYEASDRSKESWEVFKAQVLEIRAEYDRLNPPQPVYAGSALASHSLSAGGGLAGYPQAGVPNHSLGGSAFGTPRGISSPAALLGGGSGSLGAVGYARPVTIAVDNSLSAKYSAEPLINPIGSGIDRALIGEVIAIEGLNLEIYGWSFSRHVNRDFIIKKFDELQELIRTYNGSEKGDIQWSEFKDGVASLKAGFDKDAALSSPKAVRLIGEGLVGASKDPL